MPPYKHVRIFLCKATLPKSKLALTLGSTKICHEYLIIAHKSNPMLSLSQYYQSSSPLLADSLLIDQFMQVKSCGKFVRFSTRVGQNAFLIQLFGHSHSLIAAHSQVSYSELLHLERGEGKRTVHELGSIRHFGNLSLWLRHA